MKPRQKFHPLDLFFKQVTSVQDVIFNLQVREKYEKDEVPIPTSTMY